MSTGQRIRGMTTPARLSHHTERGTPVGFLKSFTARFSFKSRQILQSLKDVLIVAAAVIFCLSAAGSIIVFFIMLLFMRF